MSCTFKREPERMPCAACVPCVAATKTALTKLLRVITPLLTAGQIAHVLEQWEAVDAASESREGKPL